MMYLLLAALACAQDTDEPMEPAPIEAYGPPAPAAVGDPVDLDGDGVPDQADTVPLIDIEYDPTQLTVQQRIEHVEAQSMQTAAILKALQAAVEEEAAEEAAAEDMAAEDYDESEKDDPDYELALDPDADGGT